MSDILEQVVAVVVEQLGVEAGQVKPESHFIEDLGADSLDTVELLMALEEKFDCEIDEASAEKLTRVQDIVDYIKALETA
jgi:acyl carrier protein